MLSPQDKEYLKDHIEAVIIRLNLSKPQGIFFT